MESKISRDWCDPSFEPELDKAKLTLFCAQTPSLQKQTKMLLRETHEILGGGEGYG